MAENPTINGHKYSWASIEVHADGVDQPQITSIDYTTEGEAAEVFAKGMQQQGDTAGQFKHNGSLEMLEKQWDKLKSQLGKGFMRKRFPYTVSYDEDGEGGIITDDLIGVRIMKVNKANSVGTEASKVKLDLHIMRILYNGVDPVDEK